MSLCFINYAVFKSALVLSHIKRCSFWFFFFSGIHWPLRCANKLMGSSSWPQVIRKAVCAFKTEITTEALPWKKIKHTCQRQVNTFPHESYLTQAWRRSWLLPISLNKTENKSVCITCGLITFSTFSPWSQMTFRLMGNLGQLGVSEGWYSVNLAQLFERFCLFWSSLLFCVFFFTLVHLDTPSKSAETLHMQEAEN